MTRIFCLTAFLFSSSLLCADEFPSKPPSVETIPQPDHQVSLQVEGIEKVRWHYGEEYPRPFFYPFTSPSGTSLTRMGHPGAENHDHHRSVWFAHHDVEGHSFWSDNTEAQIRQKHWLAIEDGDEEAVYSARLGWFDPDDVELLEQDMISALRPLENSEYELEIQITLRTPENREQTILRKTNFGIFAVRVAKSISAHFGDGHLTNSEGLVGEKNIFGKQARWMDYSGPVAIGTGEERKWIREGITFFDHPENPRHPSHWHVRDDGWMGASFCFDGDYVVTKETPLTLRYLLHSHSGDVDKTSAEKRFQAFSDRSGFEILEKPEPHHQHGVKRVGQ